jgi:hypothetical protein
MKWILLISFGAVGAAALWGGLAWGSKRYQLMSGHLTAQGKVVEQAVHQPPAKKLRRGERQEGAGYFPVVEFETPEGETIRFQGTTGGEGKPIMETGTPVTVAYAAADPSNAMIVEFKQAWLGPLVLLVSGLVFLLMGVGGFFLLGRDDDRFDAAMDAMKQQSLEMQRPRAQENDPLQPR